MNNLELEAFYGPCCGIRDPGISWLWLSQARGPPPHLTGEVTKRRGTDYTSSLLHY